MPSLNRVQVMGNLGGQPETRYTASGAMVCNFSVAVNDKWRDSNDNVQERVEWVDVVAWNQLAEACSKYLDKGSPVFVEGRLETRSWLDDAEVKHYRTAVIARSVQFLAPAPRPFSEDERANAPEPPEARRTQRTQPRARNN